MLDVKSHGGKNYMTQTSLQIKDLCDRAKDFIKERKYSAAMELLNEAVALDKLSAWPVSTLGIVYFHQKQYDKAIECFRKALALDSSFVFPWNGLGKVYAEQQQYDKAIKSYRKAITLAGSFASPWNGLGNVYFHQKQFTKAIDHFQKALALDGSMPAPWNGLGNVYQKQELYDSAIECYNKAVEADATNPIPLRNLGNTYRDLQQFAEAIECYEKAIALSEKDPYRVKLLKRLIDDVRQKVESQKKLDENASVEAKILKATKDIANDVSRKNQQALVFLEEIYRDPNDMQFYLEVLQKWNSFTPIVAPHRNGSLGGGYYMRIENKGIVIDPGFNFIENFKSAAHFFAEIDIVIISHAHNDHTADLESILALLNKYNSEIKDSDDPQKESSIRQVLAKEAGIDASEVQQKDVEKEFLTSSRRKTLDIYMPLSVFVKFSGLIPLKASADYAIHIIEKKQSFDLGIMKLKIIDAKHPDIISDNCSAGFCFEFADMLLVYTGDSGWSKEIETQYINIRKNAKAKKIVLLAHLGGLKEHEEQYLLGSPDDYSHFYPHHLGRLGLCKLISSLNPSICFISEFGEELLGHRDKLSDVYQTHYPDTIFLPADIGLKYDFKKMQLWSITEVFRETREKSYDYVPIHEVSAYENVSECSIHYYSKKVAKEHLIEVVCSNCQTR